MEEDRERFQQEAVQATIMYYQLDLALVRPEVQECLLEEAERANFTAKFSVVISGYATLVWRDRDGAYKVTDDPEFQVEDPDLQLLDDEQEAAEQEAHYVLTAASEYLEIDLAKVSSVKILNLTPIMKGSASLSLSWLITLNGESCVVDHYEEDDGPRYAIRIPPTERY